VVEGRGQGVFVFSDGDKVGFFGIKIRHPFRHYRRLCSRHGILVEILRWSQTMWVAYKELLELNGNTKSEVQELRHIMGTIHITPNEKQAEKNKRNAAKKIGRRGRKLLRSLSKEFDIMLDDLEKAERGLETITENDETLLFRDIRALYEACKKLSMMHHLPYRILHSNEPDAEKGMLPHIKGLMHEIYNVQHHAWIVAKAPARGQIKFENVFAIAGSRRLRRRIRRATLGLDQLEERLEKINRLVERAGKAKTQREIEEAHGQFNHILAAYHQEIMLLKEMYHAVHVLTHRTESLFHQIKQEAGQAGFKELISRVNAAEKRFGKIHRSVMNQARRGMAEMEGMINEVNTVRYK
jgi:hypothetical protein